MIDLPAFDEQDMYDAETTWHLLLGEDRLGKLLVHWEAMKDVSRLPGAIVECGVFKGTSFVRFAVMRSLLGSNAAAKLIGFDTFGDEYPTTGFSEDLLQRQHWIDTAGGSSIGVSQLEMCLDRIGATNYQLVSGDATSTIPDFVEQNPGLRIALLNLDIDFMEPTMAALTSFWDRVVPGGIVLLDNYSGEGSSGVSLFGDTQAIDEFFRDKDVSIQRLSFVARPCFVRKPGGSRPVDPFTVKM